MSTLEHAFLEAKPSVESCCSFPEISCPPQHIQFCKPPPVTSSRNGWITESAFIQVSHVDSAGSVDKVTMHATARNSQ